MTIQQRKSHLLALGQFLGKFDGSLNSEKIPPEKQELHDEFNTEIEMAVHHNGWFTRENILFSLNQWSLALNSENLEQWLKWYDFKNTSPKTIAIIMAGNIPLVGFHDFISAILSGHGLLVKLSSNDNRFLPIIKKFLVQQDPAYSEKIQFAEGKIEGFDAVIATGSNNTARYFEYYFAKKPSIIRKNRNSVAVLTGKETKEELVALGEDIFRYFGLGCRSVSKVYVPEKYDFKMFFEAIAPWEKLLNNAKYSNNYDYNKAVYLMSEFKILDNGFLVLKEDEHYGSPIGGLFYETYSSENSLKKILQEERQKLQCVVANGILKNEIAFGDTQRPRLWDYADNVDTLAFLQKL